MKKKISIGISLAFCVLTLLTISFAWIIDVTGREARSLIVDYSGGEDGGTLIVSPSNISLSIGTKDENGNYIECDEDSLLNLSGLMPSAEITYYFRFTNKADSQQKIDLFFQNITAEETMSLKGAKTNLLDVTYATAYPTDADSEEKASKLIYVSLVDGNRLSASNNKYSFLFFDDVIIPTTGTNGYFEYTCNFIMSANAGNEYQDLDLHIGLIKIVC